MITMLQLLGGGNELAGCCGQQGGGFLLLLIKSQSEAEAIETAAIKGAAVTQT
jgi:hypothetical protein